MVFRSRSDVYDDDERDLPIWPLDVNDLLDKNQRLQRHVNALRRNYAAARIELKKAREALGYSKNGLPFF